MSKQNHITSAIVEKVRLRDRKTLADIYAKGYPMVEKYITSNNGSKQDAQDIFQDAYYLFIKKCQLADFELTAKASTYLYGISRNLWLKQLTKKQVDVTALATEQGFENMEDAIDFKKMDRLKNMKTKLEQLGEPCKTILAQYYYYQTPMKRIAEMLNYANANTAKNQKYKCITRLKNSFQ